MFIQTSSSSTSYIIFLLITWKVLFTSNLGELYFISTSNFDWNLTHWIVCVCIHTPMSSYFQCSFTGKSHTHKRTASILGVCGYNVASFLRALIKQTPLQQWLCIDLYRWAGLKPERLKGLSERKPRNRSSFLHWKFGGKTHESACYLCVHACWMYVDLLLLFLVLELYMPYLIHTY